MDLDLLEKIKAYSSESLKKLHLEIYHLEYEREGNINYLRYYIDKEDGAADLDDCVEASKVLSDLLDKRDPIAEEYMLEVSSSGAEKPLVTPEHFSKALNQFVHFYLSEKIDGLGEMEGTLLAINEDSYELEVTIKTVKKKYVVKKELVEFARLAVKF